MGSRYRREYDDPDGRRHGIPTYQWKSAPPHLATKRQLAARGLRPGGQDPVAQVLWRQWRKTAIAYLYDVGKALPKRPPSPKLLASLERALAARRTCDRCGRDVGYCLPKTGPYVGLCQEEDCPTVTRARQASGEVA